MLNKYPLWKYIMVISFLLIAGVYALPNIYGEDHAIQVSGVRGAQIDAALEARITEQLAKDNLAIKSTELERGQLLIRLPDGDTQLRAKENLIKSLGQDFVVALNLAPATPDWLKAIGASPLKLGLDLRGGVHFKMEVDMATAVAAADEQIVADLRSDLRDENIRYRRIDVASKGGVNVQFRDADVAEQGLSFLKGRYRDLVFNEVDSLNFHVAMNELKLKETKEYALKQNITIIRNRVNELGVAEPLVQRHGADRIVVELPGVQDTARAKEILGATATLEFHMVNDKADVRDALNGRVPANSKLYKDGDGRPQLLYKNVILKGNHIVDANSSFDEYGRPQVNINLDSKGGNIFSAATKKNIRKPMATVFIEHKSAGQRDKDGKLIFTKIEEVINVATIQAQLGQSFRITGLDTAAEAQNLALLLRAGALIAPIQIVEERTIGPSLGQENIDKGMQAIMFGFALILVFMTIYYRKFGLIANTALAANLILIVGVMSMLPGATLTLPGMAGIVLTVGMAVDANVLIFERIREEIKDGRSPQQAIHHGYDSAFSTIADANITTFLAAVILFAVGTGPIKGFAITLAIGIATSMFTAIVGTRAMVNLIWGGKRVEKLSI